MKYQRFSFHQIEVAEPLLVELVERRGQVLAANQVWSVKSGKLVSSLPVEVS